jgi:hypothetical protein
MSDTLLASFSSMRGFGIPGIPNGFCGGMALLYANQHRPSVAQEGYGLSLAGAKNLYTLQRARGWCAANGAQTIDSCYATLQHIATGTHNLHGYSGFSMDAFHTTLKRYAGHNAIIVEWANGQAFPGNESGLHYHFSTCGGISSDRYVEGLVGGYAFGDDDSASNVAPPNPNPPIWHDWPTIVRAQPIAYIVCEV